jgi:ATP-binding cassette subfamily B protein/ATP-binding cassette subfamily C protein
MFSGVLFLVKLYWKYNKSALFYLALHCIFSGVLPLVSIVLPKFILDELLGARRVDSLAVYVISLIASLLVGNTLINYFSTKYFLGGFKAGNQFHADLAKNLYEADLENVENPAFLDMQAKAERFIYADGQGFGMILLKTSTALSNILTLAGIISVISVLNPLIVLVFIALTLITTRFSALVKKLNVQLDLERPAQERKLSYDLSLFTDRRYSKEIRINSMGNWLRERLYVRFNILFNFYHKTFFNNFKAQAFNNGVVFIQQGLSYAYLIYSVINKKFGIGSFTMFLSAINSFSAAMTAVMDSVIDLQNLSHYYAAVKEYINMPKNQRKGITRLILSCPPLLEFRNVSFRYPGQTQNALNNINLKIQTGGKLLLAGENGAGKTTLIKLLLRLYKPTDGVILLNGTDIQEFDFDNYASQFSVVLQDFALYALSLRENVSLNGSVNADEKILDALSVSGFTDKLNGLQKKLDTSVYKTFDPEGFEPSGGEGQKIAMARALYKNSPILILDEPTAALDPRAEYEIYQKYFTMTENKTAIFISHRLASARFCQNIAVLKGGEIAEYGTHDELMKKNGSYCEFFTMQARFYEEKT